MNKRLRRLFAIAVLGALSACSLPVDERPSVIRESDSYLQHGVAAFDESDYVSATGFFNKALANYRSIDDTHGILVSHINLAETALAVGNYAAVDQHADAARKIAERSGHPEFDARIGLLRASAKVKEGDDAAAVQLISPLLPKFNEHNQPLTELTPTAISAVILRTRIAFNESEEAARDWTTRLHNTLAAKKPTPKQEARLKRFDAQLLAQDGEHARAAQLYDEALDTYHQILNRPGIAATLTEWARLEIAQQHWDSAREKLGRALFVRTFMLDRSGTAEVLEHLAQVNKALGRDHDAESCQRWLQAVAHNQPVDWELLHRAFQPF